MRWALFFGVSILLFSCSGDKQQKQTITTKDSLADTMPVIAVTIDTTAAKIYKQVLAIETEELQQFSKISRIGVKILSYDAISTRDFYMAKKEELEKAISFSSNKQKTLKAIDYLNSMISKAPAGRLYRVKFQLDAVLVNNTSYNGEYEKYLKEDLSEVKLVFP